MTHELTLYETRIIGVLLEKEITTPDQYPLSLNAIVNACNQKSNRHPVLELKEAAVKQTLDKLLKEGLVQVKNTYGGRVEKYKHRFCNTEFGELKLNPKEVAIICELFLRGPQTPGELRSRAGRMTAFADVQEVEASLKGLMEQKIRPLVTVLPREPGKRESRYAHLFSGEVELLPTAVSDAGNRAAGKARIAELEAEVERLTQENEQLRQRLRKLGQIA